MIHETVGSQDQVSAAYGGLNHITFHTNGEITVEPVTISQDRYAELNSHLMLFYTGIKRTAETVAKSYVDEIEEKKDLLIAMHSMVGEGISILTSNRCICHFGELLDEAWKVKRSLSLKVSNNFVDDYYERALQNGAIGGKNNRSRWRRVFTPFCASISSGKDSSFIKRASLRSLSI